MLKIARQPNCQVIHICDVDSRTIDKTVSRVNEITGSTPKGYTDLHKSLEDKDLMPLSYSSRSLACPGSPYGREGK
jgi:hypothetical protein